MAKKKSIKVVKVPLDKDELPSDRPQAFPKMPRLYLELIENKSKIKQDLINREYNPDDKNNTISNTPPKLEFIEKTKKNDDFDKRLDSLLDSEDEKNNNKKDKRSNESDDDSDDDNDKYKKIKLDKKSNDSDDDSDDEKDKKVEEPKPKKDDDSDNDSDDEKDKKIEEPKPKKDDDSDNDSDDEKDKKVDEPKPKKDDDSDDEDTGIKNKEKSKESNYTVKEQISKASSRDDLSGRLKELLNDTDDEKSVENNRRTVVERVPVINVKERSVDKYSRYRSQEGKSIPNYKETRTPPTLAELEAKGAYHHKKEMRDINQVTMSEQEEEDAKREMMFKFELLKKSYGNSSIPIPEFSIHSDYNSMKKTYETTVRRLSLDSSVEQYKTYLIGGFMACEFIFGNFLKLDMQGFTQQQILSMHSYEKLLIEIGEKSYVPTGSKWPVELRLLFVIIMNAAFFLVSKMIMKKTGSNLMGMINSLNTVNNTNTNNGGRKRRMKGPDIDLEEIP
jgi:hypothetical protein